MIEAGREIRAALAAAQDRILVRSADGLVTRTGAQLLQRAECLAATLSEQGLQRGIIGLYLRNSAAALEAFIATELIGATRLPVEPSAAPAEAGATFAAGGAAAVIADRHPDRPSLPADPQTWASSVLGKATLVHRDDSPLAGSRWTGTVWVEPTHPLVLYPRAVRAGELFAIPTSYANWQSIIAINQELYRGGGYGPPLAEDECYLATVQLMHVSGMVGSFPFLYLGLPQVLLSRFSAAAAVEAIEAYKITTMFAVPGMLTRIAEEVDDAALHRLGSLRRVLYGGAPVADAELRRLHRVFGATLCQLYGRYEAGWPLTILTPQDHERLIEHDEDVIGSCGRPIAAVELGLHPVPGRSGQAEVRTRSGMVSPAFADADGWCGLGDTAFLSPGGYLRLTGRLDGMINTGSFHVYPEEVREAIMEIPSISAACVVGEQDPRWGQAVTAYVVSDDPSLQTTLRDLLRDRLAGYKIPTIVHVVDHLPTMSP